MEHLPIRDSAARPRMSGCRACLQSHPRWLLLLALASPLILTLPACGGGNNASAPRKPVPLGPPDAVFPEDFGYVHTVRELPGGDLLVADPLGQALYRVHMEAGVRTQVGRVGEGPGEYGEPESVWPLRGDSTLLVDIGNGRLVWLGPEAEFSRAEPIARNMTDAGLLSGSMRVALPGAVDLSGNVYPRAGPMPDDDGRGGIVRISLEDESADTVATFKHYEYEIRTVEQGRMMQAIPLSPRDAWGAAPDGSVVIARSQGYGVDWYAPGGTIVRGDTIPYGTAPVTDAERAEYFADRRRHAEVRWGMMINAATGETITSFRRVSQTEEADFDDHAWPETLPPVHAMLIRVDPAGRAWVRRRLPAGSGTRYDLFDREGRLVRAVIAESHRFVAGFGRESAYLVAFDDLDRVWLERYRMP